MSDYRNIDSRGASLRRRGGYLCLLTAFVLVGLNKLFAPSLWARLAPAIPFFLGYLNLLQAATKTCALVALQEQDRSEGQLQPVEDRETGWRLKQRSVKLILASACLAIVSTVICLIC